MDYLALIILPIFILVIISFIFNVAVQDNVNQINSNLKIVIGSNTFPTTADYVNGTSGTHCFIVCVPAFQQLQFLWDTLSQGVARIVAFLRIVYLVVFPPPSFQSVALIIWPVYLGLYFMIGIGFVMYIRQVIGSLL